MHEMIEGISDAVKRRVDEAARREYGQLERVKGPRCLIGNVAGANDIKYAHCLSRSTESTLVGHSSMHIGIQYT